MTTLEHLTVTGLGRRYGTVPLYLPTYVSLWERKRVDILGEEEKGKHGVSMWTRKRVENSLPIVTYILEEKSR